MSVRVPDMFGLHGRVAVVTGASSGLGVAFAQGLAEAGADVALGARRADRLAARVEPRIPSGRLGSAGELAAVVVFLASAAAGYITGQTLTVDGGLTIT